MPHDAQRARATKRGVIARMVCCYAPLGKVLGCGRRRGCLIFVSVLVHRICRWRTRRQSRHSVPVRKRCLIGSNSAFHLCGPFTHSRISFGSPASAASRHTVQPLRPTCLPVYRCHSRIARRRAGSVCRIFPSLFLFVDRAAVFAARGGAIGYDPWGTFARGRAAPAVRASRTKPLSIRRRSNDRANDSAGR